MTSGVAPSTLPRLLYICDVPVESTVAGSALLFRLLENYPKDRLRIVTSDAMNQNPAKRIPGVRYDTVPLPGKALQRTRFAGRFAAWTAMRAKSRWRSFARAADGFPAEAVLTVAHGAHWRAAAELARRRGLPLHMIVHDEVVMTSAVAPRWRPRIERWFGDVYRAAASRLCVSPAMAAQYEKRFGAPGEVLYPSRAADIPEWEEPPPIRTGPTTYCFAGSINTVDYRRALADLAAELGPRGERLMIFSPISPENAPAMGLGGAHVTVQPIIHFRELLHRVRGEADVLFVPMSFAESDRINMEISFPSKLADYTVTGLPLLIWGPPYCSAVGWARDNPGSAEVVETLDPAALTASLDRLRDGGRRQELGRAALATGQTYFGHAEVARKFFGVLSKGSGRMRDTGATGTTP